jgi:hypothetical protein
VSPFPTYGAPAMTRFPTAIAAVSDIIAIRRESVRGVLALIVVGLLVVYSLGMLLYVYFRAGADAEILISGVFTRSLGSLERSSDSISDRKNRSSSRCLLTRPTSVLGERTPLLPGPLSREAHPSIVFS